MSKTYGQFCGLARSLDHIGDRWTLLVIRELLLGAASYGELQSVLDGIPTNLLAERLRHLEDDGIVTRRHDSDDRRRVTYELTSLGCDLESAVLALVRWGAHWMRTGPAGDRFEPSWAVLALRALLGDRRPVVDGSVELCVGDHRVTATSMVGGPVAVDDRPTSHPDASVDGSPELLLGLVSGQLAMENAIRRGLRVRGDRRIVRALLVP